MISGGLLVMHAAPTSQGCPPDLSNRQPAQGSSNPERSVRHTIERRSPRVLVAHLSFRLLLESLRFQY